MRRRLPVRRDFTNDPSQGTEAVGAARAGHRQGQLGARVPAAGEVTDAARPGLYSLGLSQARGLLKQNSKPAEDNPLFWLYDLKTTAWKEASEPALVEY